MFTYEISFWEKWNIFILVSNQLLITVYMVQIEMKLIAGVISLQKWTFILGEKISCKQHPKWCCMKEEICTTVSKNVWLLLNGSFISDHPRNEIHFISPVMKSDVYRISFTVGWNLILGRFRFGSHVSILLVSGYRFVTQKMDAAKSCFFTISYII